MLKHINKKHMENLIMVELQNKFNKDRISGFIIQAHRIPQDITEGPQNCFQEDPRSSNKKDGQVDAQNCFKEDGKKITNPDISSFEKKSKKDTSDLITLENKKLKGDKQGLRCSFKGCDFITTITNKCKAKKKVRRHEETHKVPKNIETTRSMSVSPKGKFADKTNKSTVTPEGKYIDKTNTKVIVETKITENTIDKIEYTDDGYDGEGMPMENFILEINCGICGTPVMTNIMDRDKYCLDGCPMEKILQKEQEAHHRHLQ